MNIDKEQDYLGIMNAIDSMQGYDFEYFCALLLLNNGFRDVEVTQASGDYGIDIIARYHNQKYGIQCKRYSKPVGKDAVNDVLGGYDHYKCDAVAVLTNSTFTSQARIQANDSAVRLWDRKYLVNNFIDKCKDLDIIEYILKNKLVKVCVEGYKEGKITDEDDLLSHLPTEIQQVIIKENKNTIENLDMNFTSSKRITKHIENKVNRNAENLQADMSGSCCKAPKLNESRFRNNDQYISKSNLMQSEQDKGIILAKDIYVKNGKIHFCNRDHTYKQAKQDRICLLGLSWILIILSVYAVFVVPFVSLFSFIVGLWGVIICKRIKQALYKYDKLKEEKIL